MSRGRVAAVCVVLTVFLAVGWALVAGGTEEESAAAERAWTIVPDYSGAVVPPNIAPLNFAIKGPGSRFVAVIGAGTPEAIEVSTNDSRVLIPEGKWRRLLDANAGGTVRVDYRAQGGGEGGGSFEFEVAVEKVDRYLAYRKLHPAHGSWREIGVYQRDLETFEETPILENDSYKSGCLNCHTFRSNHTDRMLIGIRSADYGSSAILVTDGKVQKIGTKFGYCAWHPSGKIAAYAGGNVRQFFHSARSEVRDVIDLDGFIAYYVVDEQVIRTTAELSRKDRLETYPSWSPDGKYLYYSSAPILWPYDTKFPPERFAEVRYDLVRMSYDIETDAWGEPEVLVSAEKTGKSSLEARVSPDGRFVLFCMSDYGCFPVYHRESDLYMIDLEAGQGGAYEPVRLDANSSESESWHSWSSSGRWIAFSSKRSHGVFTRLYLCYVDESGKTTKPIVVPQEDPLFYDSCLDTYNTPELLVEPALAVGEEIARVVRGKEAISVKIPITMATPKAESQASPGPYRERE